jgi:hypothetical protein
MPMQKNSVKLQQRMDSKQDFFSNPEPNLSMTRFILPYKEKRETLGLVLIQKEVHGFTQDMELKNYTLKIGTHICPGLIIAVAFYFMEMVENGVMHLAKTSPISFASLSKVSFFVQFSKIQLITSQNFNIQTFFTQFN